MNFLKAVGECAALAALAGGLLACGKTGGGAPEVDSGLPDGTPANELSVEEAEQLCNASVDAANEMFATIDECAYLAYVTTVATYAGLGGTEAELRESCDQAQTTCDEDPASGNFEFSPCVTTTAPRESCQMTVGQFEACSSDQLDQLAASFEVPETCATLTIAGLEAYLDRSGDEPAVTPACQTAMAACPEGF